MRSAPSFALPLTKSFTFQPPWIIITILFKAARRAGPSRDTLPRRVPVQSLSDVACRRLYTQRSAAQVIQLRLRFQLLMLFIRRRAISGKLSQAFDANRRSSGFPTPFNGTNINPTLLCRVFPSHLQMTAKCRISSRNYHLLILTGDTQPS